MTNLKTLLVRAGLAAIGLAPMPMAVAHDGVIESGPNPSAEIQRFVANTVEQERSTAGRKLALLREKVKYVFILFQENRSFDHLLGSFPGARGLYSQPPGQTAGYTQTLIAPDGKQVAVEPFRIGQTQ